MAAGEVPRPLHIAVDGVGGDKALLVGHAGELRVPEAHIGEPGPVEFRLLPLVVFDGGLGLAQVVGVEAPVGIQYLPVTDGQGVPGHLGGVDNDEPGEVLSEVQDGFVSPGENFLHGHLFPGADGDHGLVESLRQLPGIGHRRENGCVRPVGVIDLAVVETGVGVGAGPRHHALVPGGADMLAAVGSGQGQRPGHGGPVPVDLRLVVEGEAAAVPALAQVHLEHVLPAQQVRHVVGLDLQLPGVVGVAGGEEGVAHLLPVQLRLVDPQSGDGQRGLFHCPGGDRLGEHLHGPLLVGALGGDKQVSQLHDHFHPFRYSALVSRLLIGSLSTQFLWLSRITACTPFVRAMS